MTTLGSESGLREEVLIRETLVAAALRSSAFPGGISMTWKQLSALPLVTVRSGYGTRGRIEAAAPVGSPHHRDGGADILEPDQSSDQGPFDCRFALEPEAQFDEERLGGLKIVDDDKDVVHAFERHVLFLLTSLHLVLLPVQPA
jgi:hypothetical protein